jgi:cytochrome bd ubiquinol oxidase subunit II
VAQFPFLLPESLTIAEGAGPDATLTEILIVFGVAVVLVLPSLGLLYTLTQRGALEEEGG